MITASSASETSGEMRTKNCLLPARECRVTHVFEVIHFLLGKSRSDCPEEDGQPQPRWARFTLLAQARWFWRLCSSLSGTGGRGQEGRVWKVARA